MLFLFVAQMSTVDVSSTAVSDQDRVSATEVLTYGQWRNCVLKVTHHRSRTIKDHNAVADAAVDECNSKEADYRSTLTTLAQLYKLKDPSDFARRNVDQARKTLHDMALKELQ